MLLNKFLLVKPISSLVKLMYKFKQNKWEKQKQKKIKPYCSNTFPFYLHNFNGLKLIGIRNHVHNPNYTLTRV